MTTTDNLLYYMINYYENDPKRIQHLLKVHSFAQIIGHQEHLSVENQVILETAALIHDIGIKPSEEKYGNSNGKNQELEGPPLAKEALQMLGYPEHIIKRVCYLVGHHHTYTDINGLDYQILIEADSLVNFYEDGLSKTQIITAYDRIFKTLAGKRLCKTMYGI